MELGLLQIWERYAEQIRGQVAEDLWRVESWPEERFQEHSRIAWEILAKAKNFFLNPRTPHCRPFSVDSEFTFEERVKYAWCFINYAVAVYGTAFRIWQVIGQGVADRWNRDYSQLYWQMAVVIEDDFFEHKLKEVFPEEEQRRRFYVLHKGP